MTPTMRRRASTPGSAGVCAPPVHLGASEQRAILDLARISLAAATGRASEAALEAALAAAACITEPAAAFVTLTIDGELRGCIGGLDPDCPIPESVVGSAIGAALHDPRFRPVRASELPWIHVEVSLLGAQARLADPASFRPGVDGIIVERSGCRALLLPEVATDQGWGTIEMLEAVCQKAGLPRDAWSDARTRLSTFRTLRFGGPAVVD